ncbi:MAG: glycosyl hydrolase family 43 [Ruminococcaceae bacterium]|nr:glycosyl hydrolase family 43 [Oscillospiraceae bacterium]
MRKIINQRGNHTTRDPHVMKYNNKYYMCYTKETESVYVSCADTIEGLNNAESKCVYLPEANREYSKQLWAPELHVFDDKCYIYVACSDGDNHNHRMYVLENNSNNPMDPYTMHGKITDKTDKWAIDGTVMKYNGENYFVWSGWEGDINICQNLYIAKMKNPYELASERIMISTPEYEWEKRGATGKKDSPFINEGAYAFVADGNMYLTYSASGSWCKDYCIALLKLVGDDPLSADAWVKNNEPILSSNDEVKGPGHCSVICEDDTVHLFLHAWDQEQENIRFENVSVWQAHLKITENGAIVE